MSHTFVKSFLQHIFVLICLFYLSAGAPSPFRRFHGKRLSLPHLVLSTGSEALEVRNGWTPSADPGHPSSIHDPPFLLDLPSAILDLRPSTLDHLASLQKRHCFPSARAFSRQCRGCAGCAVQLHSRLSNFHPHVEQCQQSAKCPHHHHCVFARCSPAS